MFNFCVILVFVALGIFFVGAIFNAPIVGGIIGLFVGAVVSFLTARTKRYIPYNI